MIELLSKIETILATASNSQSSDELLSIENRSESLPSHPLTSWTGDRIVHELLAHLPQPKGVREQEVLKAFQDKKYSRCKIYLQLVENDTYIRALLFLISIPNAVKTGLPSLPALFNESAQLIIEVHDQRIADADDQQRCTWARDSAIAALEKLAIDVFAKGLGDESEQ